MDAPERLDAAPGPDPFDAALAAAIERLPDDYRAQLETVAIVVADEAIAGGAGVDGRPGPPRPLPGRAAHGARGRATPRSPASSRSTGGP